MRARPAEGGPDIPLGTLEPGPRARRLAVAAGPVAGRVARVVLDPVPALGASVDVLRVGPVTAPLPGWTARGAPDVAGRPGRRLLRASEPLELSSPAFRPGPGSRGLLVAVRGDGVLRAAAGGRRVTARATASWRDVVVPLGSRALATLSLDARPGGGPIELRDLGVVLRATRATGVRARRAGGRVRVEARLGPAGGRLAAELRDGRGRRVARGRSDAAGRLRLSARAAGRLTLIVPGDRTRIGLRARISWARPDREPGRGASGRRVTGVRRKDHRAQRDLAEQLRGRHPGGHQQVGQSLRNIEGAWVKEQKVVIADGEIKGFQAIINLTFVVE